MKTSRLIKKALLIIVGFFAITIFVLIIAMKLDSFPSQYDEIPITISKEETTDSYFKVDNKSNNTVKKLFNDLPEKLREWTKKGLTNGGEIFIVKGDAVIHHSSVGWKDTEDGEAYELNTICRIRSMTKPMIGTLALQFIENNKFKLSDKVSAYLKSFSQECTSTITIGNLLYHTSGFNEENNTIKFKNLKTGVDSVAKKCPNIIPGKKFIYSDINTAILARIMEEVSDNPIETLLKEQLFASLQLENTYTSLNASFRDKLSSTHIDVPIVGIRKYWDNNDENFVSYFRASGGIFSTPRDYAIFCSLWMQEGKFKGKEILKSKSVKEGLKAHTLSVVAKKNYYGYGMHLQIFEEQTSKYGLIYGHGGSDGTLALIIPKHQLIICFFTQTRKSKALKLFYQTIMKKIKKL